MSGPCTDCGGPDYQTLVARIAELEAARCVTCGECRYAEEQFTFAPGEYELFDDGADVCTCRNGVCFWCEDKSVNPSWFGCSLGARAEEGTAP